MSGVLCIQWGLGENLLCFVFDDQQESDSECCYLLCEVFRFLQILIVVFKFFFSSIGDEHLPCMCGGHLVSFARVA